MNPNPEPAMSKAAILEADARRAPIADVRAALIASGQQAADVAALDDAEARDWLEDWQADHFGWGEQ